MVLSAHKVSFSYKVQETELGKKSEVLCRVEYSQIISPVSERRNNSMRREEEEEINNEALVVENKLSLSSSSSCK